MRIVQLSDSHVSHLGGPSARNLERAVAAVQRLEPDLVVRTGDLVIADPDLEDDRRAAQPLLAPLGDRLRVVAGNHDVGAETMLFTDVPEWNASLAAMAHGSL